MPITPYIPQNITVHLARPEVSAANVTVSFPDYIKNVASSEIYPTWPEASIRANIYAQISFALNKIYTEYYRSRGYPFDITNSTSIDQAFVPGRNIFTNISQIVDEIFTTYIRRQGDLEPLFAEFCNGTTVTCDGLSQWGTVPLAEQGYNPYQILTYYYGDDINLVRNTPIRGLHSSYPGTPLQLGDRSGAVRTAQVMLNRISQNYPAIPKVYPVDGIFGTGTEQSVLAFQRIFNLTADGIVGRGTWYQMVYLYVSVKRLNELESEGQSILGLDLAYPDAIQPGDQGEKVYILQYFLNSLSNFYNQIPPVALDSIFGPATEQSVLAFQRLFGLPQTGIVGAETWSVLYNAFIGIADELERSANNVIIKTEPYPGYELQYGSTGESVRVLQEYLNFISNTYNSIPPVKVTGEFGSYTRNSVTIFQRTFDLPETGIVDKETWDTLASVYYDTLTATAPTARQYPGYVLQEGYRDVQPQ